MPKYAKDTTVSVSRSKDEIERTVSRYGATSFFSAWNEDSALVGFQIEGRTIKIRVPLPTRDDVSSTPTGRPRNQASTSKAWERAQKQRWRALALIIKAKLEAIDSGISTVEREFLADLVMPSGSTFGEWAVADAGSVEATKLGRRELLWDQSRSGSSIHAVIHRLPLEEAEASSRCRGCRSGATPWYPHRMLELLDWSEREIAYLQKREFEMKSKVDAMNGRLEPISIAAQRLLFEDAWRAGYKQCFQDAPALLETPTLEVKFTAWWDKHGVEPGRKG